MTIRHEYNYQLFPYKINEIVYTLGSYHYNWHEEYELFWVLRGKVEMNISGQIYNLNTDDLIMINSNVGHASFAQQKDTLALRIHIEPSFYEKQGISITSGRFELNTLDNKKDPKFNEIRYCLAKIHMSHILENTQPFIINSLYFRLTSLLHSFYINSEEYEVSSMDSELNATIRELVDYIEEHYSSNFTLEDLAKKFGYTTTYLSRLMKENVGINYYEYLSRCRLREAVNLLSGQDKIAEIALNVGFSDVRSFNNMFKKHFGLTPSEYRKQLSDTNQLYNDSFKKEISSPNKQFYQNKLLGIISSFETGIDKNNPCNNCVSKVYQKKYLDLKNKVINLI